LADIQIDFAGVKATSDKVWDAVYAQCNQHQVPAFVATILAQTAAVCVFVPLFIVAAIVQGVVGVGTWFAVTILGLFTKVRTENASDFNQVIAAALSELLGYEISPDSFSNGQGPQGLNDRITSIGKALHDLLAGEFVSGGEVTPDQGKANAEKFSGFAINFATGSAFLAILTEACSIGFLKEFRELGEQVAQSIGLGRLQRLALQPLIRNAIQQPYDMYYRNLLRADRLSEAQIVQALRAGDLTEDQARQELAYKGYPDRFIDILIDQLSLKVTASELAALIRYNLIDQQTALDGLKTQGMTEDDAKNLLASLDCVRADSHLSSHLSNMESARLAGFIGQDEFVANLQDLGIGKEETDMYLKKVSFQLERPRTTITFAQLKSGVVSGIVDFDYVDTWLKNKGYSDQDNLILTYEIIQALDTAEAKAKAKTTTATKLTAAGKPVPPPLTTP